MAKVFIVLPANTMIPNESDDEATAIASAEQLAASQPGEAFAVYELIATTAAPAPVKPTVTPTTTRRSRSTP